MADDLLAQMDNIIRDFCPMDTYSNELEVGATRNRSATGGHVIKVVLKRKGG